jgi:hypothetical protein
MKRKTKSSSSLQKFNILEETSDPSPAGYKEALVASLEESRYAKDRFFFLGILYQLSRFDLGIRRPENFLDSWVVVWWWFSESKWNILEANLDKFCSEFNISHKLVYLYLSPRFFNAYAKAQKMLEEASE